MSYFVDTSALFKRYQIEKGTVLLAQIFSASSQPIFISSITIIEIISNLRRLCEVDQITTEGQFHEQRAFFYQDMGALRITILDITVKTLSRPKTLS